MDICYKLQFCTFYSIIRFYQFVYSFLKIRYFNSLYNSLITGKYEMLN